MNIGSLWFGIGFESGGEIIAGINSHQGVLYSYGDQLRSPKQTRYCTIEQKSVTVGLGLGGSGGLTFLIGLNGGDPQQFSQAAEWGADYSFDVGIGGLAKYVRTLPEIVELAKLANTMSKTQRVAADMLLSYEKNRYLVKDVAEGLIKNRDGIFNAAGGAAGIIVLPMPEANYGLRLSIKAKWEGTTVTTWGTFDFTQGATAVQGGGGSW